MQRSICRGILPILGYLASLAMTTPAGAQGIAWQEDYTRGRAEARAAGRPLLVTIVSATDDRCSKWMATTLGDPAVVAIIQRDFLAVRLDAKRYANEVKQLGLRSFPMTIFAAADGSILHAVDGTVDAKVMIANLQEALAKLRKPQPVALPVSRTTAAPMPAPIPIAAPSTSLWGTGYPGYYGAAAYGYPQNGFGFGYPAYSPSANYWTGTNQPTFAPAKRSC